MLFKVQDTAKIKHEDVKQSIMTACYGSRAMPKTIFGEGHLLDVFYQTLSEEIPGAWELNEAMLALWDPNTLINEWTMPDNFHVKIKVMGQVKETVQFLNEPFDVFYNVNMPVEEGRSLGANLHHSVDGMIVREITRRCDYNPKQLNKIKELISIGSGNKSTCTKDDDIVITLWDHYNSCGILSARIIQHLNADNFGHVDINVIRELVESFPEKPFKVISIHQWWIQNCVNCWKPNLIL